ncbi:MAG: hypothetical protein ACE37M_10985 [Henriciella sp.]
MRKILIGAAGFLVLTACGDSAEVSLNKTCNAVMADPDVQRDILEASISAEDYCACTSKQILALPDTARDTAISTLESMETLMAEHNGSAEAAFRALSEARRADDATPEAEAAYKRMDDLGEQLEDYLDLMRAAGGACPI